MSPTLVSPVLALEGVGKAYGTTTAVERLDLTLEKGEFLTLLGPSGCGKTTSLRIAIGLERAGAGRVLYNGRVVDSPAERVFVPPERRAMGMVFQSYAIWPHLSVFENVAFPLRSQGARRDVIKTRVGEALELVGLSHLAERGGTQLSGGQQQRVAVARGLVAGTDLLLMDEPFSNLDARLRDQMRAELKALQRRLGIAILFVTHDQTEALALSDRIAVMRGGRLEQMGAPHDLYTAPGTPFVRDFLGHAIHLPAKLIARTDGVAMVRLALGATVEVSGRFHLGTSNPGAECLVTVRPEEIRIEPREAGAPEGNAVDASITTLLFLGQQYEAAVALAGGGEAMIQLPRSTTWREGQAIRLHLPPAALQLWEPEA